MDSNNAVNLIKGLAAGGPWIFVKWMFVVGLFVYLMFALIIVRQAQIMNQTIDGMYNKTVKLGAWLHFGLTIFVLIMAIVLL